MKDFEEAVMNPEKLTQLGEKWDINTVEMGSYFKGRCGYCYKDFNNDGVDELVVGSGNPDEAHDGEVLGDPLVLFTSKDGEPCVVFNGWSRSSYRFLEDGCILHRESNGAANNQIVVYHLKDDGSLQVDVAFVVDGSSAYRTTDDGFDVSNGVEISLDEYKQNSDDFFSRPVKN